VLLEAHNIAQVSINLVNFHITPPHMAFEKVKREAEALGITATGSEIVGMTPKEALLVAGKFYAPDLHNEGELLNVAVRRLGLSQLDPFDTTRKIIEYQL
jgi:glutamate formiminotransferase